MEARPDAAYWIAEALIMSNAEMKGQEIAVDIRAKQNGNSQK